MEQGVYRRWFLGIVGAAAVWRVLYVLVFKVDDGVVGDQIYYSGQAVTIANGEWFAEPFTEGYAADHPPLTALMVAPASWDNAEPYVMQRLLMAMYGVGVVAGIGVVTRWLADRVTSLVATGIAAVYANLWMNDGLIMAETPAALAVVALLFAAYRFDLARSNRDAVVLGALVGVAGLARSELLLLGVLLVLPIALWGAHAPDDRGRRVAHLALAGLAALTVITPWVIRNNLRFDETVTMSTQDGLTLIGTNCPPAFEGPGRGFWHLSCALETPTPENADQSVRSGIYRDEALDYLSANIDRLPSVMIARLGRGLSLWQPDAMSVINQAKGREFGASRIGVWQFWLLAPLAAFGLVRWPIAQRRGPMIALMVMSLLTIVALYGIPRFRIAAEVSIVVCAGIGVTTLWRQLTGDSKSISSSSSHSHTI